MSATEQGLIAKSDSANPISDRPVLLKVDSVAWALEKSTDAVFDMADYNALRFQPSLKFVFNVATDLNGEHRDLRFWAGEVFAMKLGPAFLARHQKFTIDQALAAILPTSRERFHAGEVTKLLQIRRISLMRLRDQIGGSLAATSSFYPRDSFAAFLKSRWLGGGL